MVRHWLFWTCLLAAIAFAPALSAQQYSEPAASSFAPPLAPPFTEPAASATTSGLPADWIPQTTAPPASKPISYGLPYEEASPTGSTTELERRIAELEQTVLELRESTSTHASTSTSMLDAAADPAEAQKQFNAMYDVARGRYPSVVVGGVFQADAGFFNQDAASIARFGRVQDGADFRRARLSAKGSVAETVNYFFQMDFAFFGRPTFTDVWAEMVELPVLGAFRVGQWKQPFSLEVVSSFRYTTFMERSLAFTAFTPFRHLGAGFYNHSQDLSMTWAASGFRTGQDQFAGSISTDGGWGTAERFTWLPYYDEPSNGRYYTHLGMGHFFNNPPRDLAIFRSGPEFYVGEQFPGAIGTSGIPTTGVFNGTPIVATSGPLLLSSYNVLGAELLWVNGPLSVQAEPMVVFANREVGSNLIFSGGYLQVGYFLTGEHRPYDRVAGAIDRVIPFENAFGVRTPDGTICRGRGAWEVAGRISYLDLQDEDVNGGTTTDLTFGVNWYLNPYTKAVFNFIHSRPNTPATGPSVMNIVGMRLQMDF